MSQTNNVDALLTRLKAATGNDREIDRLIDEAARSLTGDADAGDDAGIPRYTSSVDLSLDLIHRLRPGWHWHTGFGVKGITPYASLSEDSNSDDAERFEASAPTVPLALLITLFEALSKAGNAQFVTNVTPTALSKP